MRVEVIGWRAQEMRNGRSNACEFALVGVMEGDQSFGECKRPPCGGIKSGVHIVVDGVDENKRYGMPDKLLCGSARGEAQVFQIRNVCDVARKGGELGFRSPVSGE